MAGKQRTGTCVYCGTRGQVTKDHVPPKCLFPPDTRINLITVPACPACHDSYSLDDEYFRVVLSFRADLPPGPHAEFLREETGRTLLKQEAQKFRNNLIGSVKTFPFISPNGVRHGSHGLEVDYRRIKATASRMVRGLYAKLVGYPVSRGWELTVNLIDLQRDSSAILRPEVQEVLLHLGEHGMRRLFDGVLDVRYTRMEDDSHSTIWAIRVHDAFEFIAFTVPVGEEVVAS